MFHNTSNSTLGDANLIISDNFRSVSNYLHVQNAYKMSSSNGTNTLQHYMQGLLIYKETVLMPPAPNIFCVLYRNITRLQPLTNNAVIHIRKTATE